MKNYDFWHINRCRVNSKGSNGLNFEWNYTQLKVKPGTVEKNESTMGLPAGVEPIREGDAGAMLSPLSEVPKIVIDLP